MIFLVGKEGLEPSRPVGQNILSVSRIPAPPLAHGQKNNKFIQLCEVLPRQKTYDIVFFVKNTPALARFWRGWVVKKFKKMRQ